MQIRRSDIEATIVMIIIGAIAGAIYVRIAYLSRPDAIGTVLLGAGLGGLIGGGIAFFETVFFAKPYSRIRRLPFLASVAVRIFVHANIVLGSRIVAQTVYTATSGNEIKLIGGAQRDSLVDTGFTVFLIVIFVFFFQMRNFIGGRTLSNLLLGRYSKPKVEDRIFMILDLVGSTKLAQKIGDVAFHEYLNAVFVLVDDAIASSGGEVHSYVGDSIFVTWRYTKDPKKNARALDAFVKINEAMSEHAAKIEAKYGERPDIRLAFHKGRIVAGETGFRKRQITYLGNTVNLVSRIESLTKTGIGHYLASNEYLEACEIPSNVSVTPLGAYELKGSQSPMPVSRLEVS